MFMATGTLYGGGTKTVEYIGNNIIPIQVAGDFSIHLGLRHFHVSDKIPWSCRQKAKGQDSVGIRVEFNYVPGKGHFGDKGRLGPEGPGPSDKYGDEGIY